MTPTPDRAALGARLRAAREAAGLTQREVQRRAGIEQATVSRMENGSQEPSSLELWRLAVLYGVSVAALLPVPGDETTGRVASEVVRIGPLNEDGNDRAGVQLR